MPLREQELDRIVRDVLEQIGYASTQATVTPDIDSEVRSGGGVVYADLEGAVAQAQRSVKPLLDGGLDLRHKMIAAMRQTARDHAELLGRMAVEETGLGKMPDKMNKVLLAASKTPGPEDLKPEGYSGDHGLTIEEPAPFGVVGSITPSTNPASTIVNNAISLLSAGNTVVFCPHPAAKATCVKTATLLSDAIAAVGGPRGCLTILANPTQEAAQALMRHKGIDLLVVTGGMVVVKLAMTSGTRAICAGPGNPPVVVDETALIGKAARDIVTGASFDNNVLCTDEKSLFVVDRVASDLKRQMVAAGAYELKGVEIDRLVKLLVAEDRKGRGHRHVTGHREWVGKDAALLLKAIDIKPPPDVKLIVFEAPWDHPLVMAEQLTPALPLVRCRNVEEAIDFAITAEHDFRHTFIMHSTSLPNLSRMAQLCRGNIFVKNAPNLAGLGMGGEGFCTLTIAGTTGEGLTRARVFSRPRRCTLVDYFRIV
jgi:acyl-CoA reductase-like NAD-dependent aldehyde dehydrogenase